MAVSSTRSSLLCFGMVMSLLLAGCMTHYPLGMSEAEWNRLTPEQQLDARERQQRLSADAAQRRAEAQRLQQEQARQEAEALEQRRLAAAHGDRLQCVLDDAELRLGSDWRPADPVVLDLLRGERQDFRLNLQGSTHRNLGAEAYFDGLRVRLCRPGERDCAVIVGTSGDFQRGISRPVQVRDTLQGQLRCELFNPQGSRSPRPGRW